MKLGVRNRLDRFRSELNEDGQQQGGSQHLQWAKSEAVVSVVVVVVSLPTKVVRASPCVLVVMHHRAKTGLVSRKLCLFWFLLTTHTMIINNSVLVLF